MHQALLEMALSENFMLLLIYQTKNQVERMTSGERHRSSFDQRRMTPLNYLQSEQSFEGVACLSSGPTKIPITDSKFPCLNLIPFVFYFKLMQVETKPDLK